MEKNFFGEHDLEDSAAEDGRKFAPGLVSANRWITLHEHVSTLFCLDHIGTTNCKVASGNANIAI